MSTLEIVLIALLGATIALAAGSFLAWRLAGERGRAFSRRFGALPWRQKLRFARSLFVDPRLPGYTRAGLALMALYLALPIDLVPDFIPVLGQLDDILLLALGAALLLRTAPAAVVEEHLSRLEAEAAGGSAGV